MQMVVFLLLCDDGRFSVVEGAVIQCRATDKVLVPILNFDRCSLRLGFGFCIAVFEACQLRNGALGVTIHVQELSAFHRRLNFCLRSD